MRRSAPSWRSLLMGTTLLASGAVHVAPGVALVLPDRLGSLYGLGRLEPTEVVLLRHRALLLALLGAALLGAVARPALRRPALAATLASDVVFIGLAATTESSTEVTRVALVDGVLLPLVLAALVVDSGGRARPVGAVPPR